MTQDVWRCLASATERVVRSGPGSSRRSRLSLCIWADPAASVDNRQTFSLFLFLLKHVNKMMSGLEASGPADVNGAGLWGFSRFRAKKENKISKFMIYNQAAHM